jgi:hypothetical protein
MTVAKFGRMRPIPGFSLRVSIERMLSPFPRDFNDIHRLAITLSAGEVVLAVVSAPLQ